MELRRSLHWILCVVVVITLLFDACLAEDKLQIGIKKKVPNCKTRSKKGDTLHMHYTVNLLNLINTTCTSIYMSLNAMLIYEKFLYNTEIGVVCDSDFVPIFQSLFMA